MRPNVIYKTFLAKSWTTISLDMKEKVKVSIMGSVYQSSLKANISTHPHEKNSEYMYITTNFVITLFKQN